MREKLWMSNVCVVNIDVIQLIFFSEEKKNFMSSRIFVFFRDNLFSKQNLHRTLVLLSKNQIFLYLLKNRDLIVKMSLYLVNTYILFMYFMHPTMCKNFLTKRNYEMKHENFAVLLVVDIVVKFCMNHVNF